MKFKKLSKNNELLRQEVTRFLKGGVAYMTLDEAIADFPVEHINAKANNVPYTFWHILEHIRITQWDILDFCKNPNYKYIKWPDDYWPKQNATATKKQWGKTTQAIKQDLSEIIRLVQDPRNDLYKPFPWGEGQHLLRETILVAEHNSYHIGEFAILRQVEGMWPKSHK